MMTTVRGRSSLTVDAKLFVEHVLCLDLLLSNECSYVEAFSTNFVEFTEAVSVDRKHFDTQGFGVMPSWARYMTRPVLQC